MPSHILVFSCQHFKESCSLCIQGEESSKFLRLVGS